MLCTSYAHVHLYLYRSSLRHAIKTPEPKSSPGLDLSSHATRCIQSAQNIILLFEDMCRRGLLKGGNWSAVRMLCSSITTLLYIMLASRGSYEPKSLFKRLATGRKILNHLAKQSLPASRCRVLLAVRYNPNHISLYLSMPYLLTFQEHDLNSTERFSKDPR
jgi:hypothetical protein